MKLKVVGWTHNDDYHYPENDGSFAARAAVVDEIREHGYEFSGMHHQNISNCTPILSDMTMFGCTQRGWGDVMAEAHGETHPMAYARYAFFCEDEEEYMVFPQNNIEDVLYYAAVEELGEEKAELLFKADYTLRCPHPELGDKEIYKLSDEEVEEMGLVRITRQVPPAVCRHVFGDDLRDVYVLEESACVIEEGYIFTKLRDEYRYMAPEDVVVIGETTYTVRDVDWYKDVPEEVQRTVMYHMNEGYDQAVEQFMAADTIMKIKI